MQVVVVDDEKARHAMRGRHREGTRIAWFKTRYLLAHRFRRQFLTNLSRKK
jgi:hypothetical protein